MCFRLEFDRGSNMAKNRLSGARLALNIVGIIIVLLIGAAAAVIAVFATTWWPKYDFNDNVYKKLEKFDSKVVNMTKKLASECTNYDEALKMSGRYVYRCNLEKRALCIPMDQRCDGYEECDDGNDEKDCSKVCDTRVRFKCDILTESGEEDVGCFHTDYRCDGEVDCTGENPKANDESNCKNEFVIGHTGVTCGGDNRWTCKDGKQCVPVSARCDGADNCWDGSDEAGCAYL